MCWQQTGFTGGLQIILNIWESVSRRRLGIRLLLADWQVDDDSKCLNEVEEEEEKEWVPDYSKEYEDYWQEYQQYSADQLQLYQDFINDEVTNQVVTKVHLISQSRSMRTTTGERRTGRQLCRL